MIPYFKSWNVVDYLDFMAKKIFDHPLFERGDEKTKQQAEPGYILVFGKHTVNNEEIEITFKKGEFFNFLNFLADKFKGDGPAEPAIEDLQRWYSEFSGVPIPEKPKVDISTPVIEEIENISAEDVPVE